MPNSRPMPGIQVRTPGVGMPLENRWLRGWLVAMGLGLMALLIAARIVQPAADGVGTHEQLGLPPCGFRLMFGRPCPSCGMTTSWAHLMRGQLTQAALTHPGGMLLGLATLVAAPWLVLSGLRGKWFLSPPLFLPLTIVGAVILLTTFVSWVVKLFG